MFFPQAGFRHFVNGSEWFRMVPFANGSTRQWFHLRMVCPKWNQMVPKWNQVVPKWNQMVPEWNKWNWFLMVSLNGL